MCVPDKKSTKKLYFENCSIEFAESSHKAFLNQANSNKEIKNWGNNVGLATIVTQSGLEDDHSGNYCFFIFQF